MNPHDNNHWEQFITEKICKDKANYDEWLKAPLEFLRLQGIDIPPLSQGNSEVLSKTLSGIQIPDPTMLRSIWGDAGKAVACPGCKVGLVVATAAVVIFTWEFFVAAFGGEAEAAVAASIASDSELAEIVDGLVDEAPSWLQKLADVTKCGIEQVAKWAAAAFRETCKKLVAGGSVGLIPGYAITTFTDSFVSKPCKHWGLC